MLPTHAEIEMRLAESHRNNFRRESSQQFRMGASDRPEPAYDLGKPAFPQWRTAAQMAFAVTVTMLTLFIVIASIVAITRA